MSHSFPLTHFVFFFSCIYKASIMLIYHIYFMTRFYPIVGTFPLVKMKFIASSKYRHNIVNKAYDISRLAVWNSRGIQKRRKEWQHPKYTWRHKSICNLLLIHWNKWHKKSKQYKGKESKNQTIVQVIEQKESRVGIVFCRLLLYLQCRAVVLLDFSSTWIHYLQPTIEMHFYSVRVVVAF
jgi:hypothetical protein